MIHLIEIKDKTSHRGVFDVKEKEYGLNFCGSNVKGAAYAHLTVLFYVNITFLWIAIYTNIVKSVCII